MLVFIFGKRANRKLNEGSSFSCIAAWAANSRDLEINACSYAFLACLRGICRNQNSACLDLIQIVAGMT